MYPLYRTSSSLTEIILKSLAPMLNSVWWLGKTMSKAEENPYNMSYFHGIGSCYPKEGYEIGGHKYQKRPVRYVLRKKGCPVKWLDIGCAYGILVKYAFENGIDAYGVDISPYAIEQGKKLFPEISNRLFVCGINGLRGFFKEQFDVISMIEILEHLQDPRESLRIVTKVLRKDGLVIIKTPTPRNPNSKRDVTHISVKPVSFWASSLRELNYKVKAPYFPDEPKYLHGLIAELWRMSLAYAHMIRCNDAWVLGTKL